MGHTVMSHVRWALASESRRHFLGQGLAVAETVNIFGQGGCARNH